MNNELDINAEEIERRIEYCVGYLMEFMDSVQIVGSQLLPGGEGTRTFNRGGGNWEARVQLCRAMAKDADTRDRAEIYAQVFGRQGRPPGPINPPSDLEFPED